MRKYVPSSMESKKPLSFSSKVREDAEPAVSGTSHTTGNVVDIDLREVYFLIMHFLSSGPCHRTYGQLWNELLQHQLLPRRYHAWYSKSGVQREDENADAVSFPLSYPDLVERYPHVEKDHLVKLLQRLLCGASPQRNLFGGGHPNAADVPTLLGTGSFSLLSDKNDAKYQSNRPPAHMRWPHLRANQIHGLSLREIGGGFPRHHRAPSVRAACYAIAKPSTMVQKMQHVKRLRGHRTAVYCAIFDRLGRYVITGSDDRLVKIWSMETAFCLASCRGHEGDITDLAVSSNNILVASASNDCIIRVWHLPDGLPVSVLRGHTGAVTAIAFSPRPTSIYQLLSSSDDGTCRIWDARYSQLPPQVYVPKPSDSQAGKSNGASSSNAPQSHQIFCCAFNANGTVFVTGSSDNLARVWNACKPRSDDPQQPNHEMDVLSGHENDVNYVQFSGCSLTSRFSMSDIGKEENVPKFKNSWFSHDNIVTCSRDGSAIIWVPRSRRSHGRAGRWVRAYHLRVPPPPLPPQPPRGGPRQRILPTPRGVNMIVWSLDNRFVLAAIMDCRICVWNAADGSLVHSLTGHSASTYALDVHPFNPRIAMSAGYDGKTIVWDIWEGVPIRIYEISHFKLVDGKFSADGTSIILSDDVGQLYILSTGQGESQKNAKYDQFFLGDYRPLKRDTYGNVLDEETQLVPYRRNMQDLLCDAGMIPYEEPYQSMYQRRRLGALGMEWKPSSLKFAIGPDFNVDPEFQMLPLVDLDVMAEPLPEVLDVMEWEPENEAQNEDTDSEYDVAEEYSNGDERRSIHSDSSTDPECGVEDSDAEGMDDLRKSKKKKQKTEIGIMTSSGRRIKRRHLDEREGSSSRSIRSRKMRHGFGKRKSSTSKASRPRRAAARNALSLFSKITGTASDREEDEDGSESELSGSESILQDLNTGSEETDESQQIEQSRRPKGKDVLEDSEDLFRSHDFPESHKNDGSRRLILKLPVRGSNKKEASDIVMRKDDNLVDLVGLSPKAGQEVNEGRADNTIPVDPGYSAGPSGSSIAGRGSWQMENYHIDWIEGYKNNDIKWVGVRARSSKRRRLGDVTSLAAGTRLVEYLGNHNKKQNMNLQVPTKCVKDHRPISMGGEFEDHANEKSIAVETDLRNTSGDRSKIVNNVTTVQDEHGFNGYLGSNELQNLSSITKVSGEIGENGNLSHERAHVGDESSDAQVAGTPIPASGTATESHSLQDKMYGLVYRRSKLHRNWVTESGGDAGAREKLNTSNCERNTRVDHIEGKSNGANIPNSEALKDHPQSATLGPSQEDETKYITRRNSQNGSASRSKLPSDELGSISRMTVGQRSSRNRRTSYNFTDSSPIERRKPPQPIKGGSWLMLSVHEGSRYIPQLGDEVAYLRQGHQEYIEYSGSKEVGPWTYVKGNIRAVEFCKVERLDYVQLPGSGDSCCKMRIKFVDPDSDVNQKSFKLTLPEVTSFPDFIVERSRFEVSLLRNWTCRDHCRVWWKYEGQEDGSWWRGRIVSIQPKSPQFPESPWERYTIKYTDDPSGTHQHSPWELFPVHDDDTEWEEPCVSDDIRNKLVSALAKLEQSGSKAQDRYGVQKLREVSQKSNFINKFPVPISVELIKSRLENNYYRRIEALGHDIEVMLSNAESYIGKKNQELSQKMLKLSSWFEQSLSPFLSSD